MPKAITGDKVPAENKVCGGPGSHSGSASDKLSGPGGTLLLGFSVSSGVRSIFPKGDGCETGGVRCDAGACRGTVRYLLECVNIHSNGSWPFPQHFYRNAPRGAPGNREIQQGDLE